MSGEKTEDDTPKDDIQQIATFLVKRALQEFKVTTNDGQFLVNMENTQWNAYCATENALNNQLYCSMLGENIPFRRLSLDGELEREHLNIKSMRIEMKLKLLNNATFKADGLKEVFWIDSREPFDVRGYFMRLIESSSCNLV